MRPQHKNPRYLAQDILSRRDHSEAELRRKLARKKIPKEDIDDAIHWLKTKKYLSNDRFVESFIAQTLRAKPVGPLWLKGKLRQKGLSSDAINQALKKHYPPEKKLVEQAITRWQKSHPKKAEDKPKLARHLVSRGFSSSLIRDLLQDL